MRMDRLHSVPLPDRAALEQGLWHWLKGQPGPVWMTQPGRDPSRHRVVLTLLHGNEPSGSHGIWHWLSQGAVPAVTCHFCLVNLQAALAEPGFAHRHLPGQPDLNRCFGTPATTQSDHPAWQLAHALWQKISALQPEAVVDLHNTSGSGPSFAVATVNDERHRALAALFTERMLLTEVMLGALMERTNSHFPIVTIECGGAVDPQANAVAADGVRRFCLSERIDAAPEGDWRLEVLEKPLRVQLSPGCAVDYAERPSDWADLTLPPDIERLNFGWLAAGEPLGWLGSLGLRALTLNDGHGQLDAATLFYQEGERLCLAQDCKLFMITTYPEIAVSDCLFYAVRAEP